MSVRKGIVWGLFWIGNWGVIVSQALFAQGDPYAAFIAPTGPLAPQEQQRRFCLPPGFRIQLVAAEPEIAKPINLNFDRQGRLYVTCTVEYPFAAPPGKGRDFVVRIHFRRDGSFRKVERVVSGLNIPIGITPVQDRLLLWSIPAVYQYQDQDADGRYEHSKKLLSGFEYRDTHGMVNSLLYWVDGWVYACHGFANRSRVRGQDDSEIVMHSGNTFRFLPNGTRLEHYSFGQVNPFGLAFDRWGQLYSADCHSRPAYLLLPGAYYPSFGRPHDGLGFGPEIMRHSHGSTAIAGVAYYAAEQFPKQYWDNLFIGNPVTGRVNRDRLVRRGASYQAVEMPDFVSCEDPWFRPVDVELGPDGALYIADFYNRIIGHYEVPLDHPGRDRRRGRVWRVVYAPQGSSPPPAPPDLTKWETARLVQALGHPNLTLVRLCVQELVLRKRQEVRSAVLQVFDNSQASSGQQRAFALWVLHRTGGVPTEVISRAAVDPSPLVRAHLLQLLAQCSWPFQAADREVPVLKLVHRALEDRQPVVRRLAAVALGRHPRLENIPALWALWQRSHPEDRFLIHSVRIALRNQLLLPQAYSQLAELLPQDGSTQAQLAKLSLGVPTPQAARFLLHRLKHQDTSGWPEEQLAHVIAHLPAGELKQWEKELLARLEAVESLARLKLLRRVAGAYQRRGQPWPERFAHLAAQTAQELLQSGDPFRTNQAFGFLRQVRPPGMAAVVRSWAENPKHPPALRAQALETLVALSGEKSLELLVSVIRSGQEPLELRTKAAQLLGSLSHHSARQALLEAMEIVPLKVAQVGARTLAWDSRWAPRLVQAVQQGRINARVLQDLHVLRGLRRVAQRLMPQAEKLTAHLPTASEKLRQAVAQRVQRVLAGQADPQKGQKVFEKHCQACHRFGTRGTKVGPDLDGVAARGPLRLAEDILDPSARVDQAFRLTQIVTTQGQVLQGLLLPQQGAVLTLVDSQGQRISVAPSEVEQMQQLPLSPMPNNFVEKLTTEQTADLLAFLLTGPKEYGKLPLVAPEPANRKE